MYSIPIVFSVIPRVWFFSPRMLRVISVGSVVFSGVYMFLKSR